MDTYQTAKEQYAVVAQAAQHDDDAVRALWDAVTGMPDLVPTSAAYPTAVSDTYPVKLAAVLTSGAACSYAMACMLRSYGETFQLSVTTDNASNIAAHISQQRPPIELREAARRGWKMFEQRVEQAGDIVTGTGWDLSASLPHIQKIPDRSSQMAMLKRVADLAGRMHRSLRGARSKRMPGMPGEYSGVEQSDALRRMTGSQQQPLAHDLAEWLVWEAYVRKGLQTFKTRGPAKAGRGPLVIAIDESGSMKGARNEWAKAAMMALTRSAHEDKREVAVVAFSDATHVTYLRAGDVESQIAALFHFMGGGTDIPRALRVGHKQVGALAKKGHAGADVILITDGEDPQDDEKRAAIEAFIAQGTRLWTIAIDIPTREDDPIRSLATKYVPLDHAAMNDPAALTAVVNAL